MLFSRFFRRGDAEEKTPNTKEKPSIRVSAPSSSPAPANAPVATHPEKSSATTPATRTAEPAQAEENDSSLFAEMEEILGRSADMLRIPCRALLSILPEELRGEAYRADAIPEDVCIELDQADLLEQLRRGRVVYSLDSLATMLPAGWVRPDADTHVELNLPDVVEALPPDLLQGAEQLHEETIEAAQMRDYFRPDAKTLPPDEPADPDRMPEEAAIPDPAPEGTPAAAPKKPVVLQPVAAQAAVPAKAQPRKKPVPPPWAWDGMERGRDAGAQAIDLNRAGPDDLATIPGLGRFRADLILTWREKYGPFKSIYDLVEMPGVGRRLFKQLTGLHAAVTKRVDRHTLLNEWLGLPSNARPGLRQLAEHLCAALSLSDCVIADDQGIALAAASKSEEQAECLAAITPKLFRRTRRYLNPLDSGGDRLIFLPLAETPLALVRTGHMYVAALFLPETDWRETINRLEKIGTELEWLLGPRLVVHGPNTTEE